MTLQKRITLRLGSKGRMPRSNTTMPPMKVTTFRAEPDLVRALHYAARAEGRLFGAYIRALLRAGLVMARTSPLIADDSPWTPFVEPSDWLAGVDPDEGLAGIIVRLIRIVDAKNELISAALTRLHEQERELGAIRRRHHALIAEY